MVGYNFTMPKVAPLQSDEILFEDNHLLVLNKRSGIATMGAESGTETLLTLAKDYIRRKYNKPGNVYLGIVSRLDAKTSGAIVIARTSKAAARLTEQFKSRQTTKRYWAIVANGQGESIAKSGVLEDIMFKDEKAMRMRCVPPKQVNSRKIPRDAKSAKLLWNCLSSVRNQHLLEIELETGRKHQIRCQFAFAGFPVLGDRKYGSDLRFSGEAIALHSRTIKITHPTLKTDQQFEAPIPDYWKLARFNL
jgi:23S rRNA pseudouridine1911/1915/1917 synthase